MSLSGTSVGFGRVSYTHRVTTGLGMPSQLAMLLIAMTGALTFVLGGTTFLAFFLVGGRVATLGPAVLREAWPVIYALVAALAVAVGFVMARLVGRRVGFPALAAALFAAWIGEYLVLASGVVADELNPLNALYYWTLATAGPLQPAAALTGAWIGLRRGR